jgi:AraC-like DNA-binding protein
MHYREFLPHPSLREFVKCLWTLQHDYSQSIHAQEQLPPSGKIELIFHYGDSFMLQDGNNWVRQPVSFIIGQQDRFFVLRSAGNTGLVAARFHPWGAFPFFQIPISALHCQFVGLDAIVGNHAAKLEDCLARATTAEALRILENFLLLQLRHFGQDISLVISLVRRIIAQQGNLCVSELIRDEGVSQRQIERRFNEVVGLPPKRLARIIRFQHAFRSISSQPSRELTDISYQHGYSDQSHFIKDCQLLYGKTPSSIRCDAIRKLPENFDVEFLQSGVN